MKKIIGILFLGSCMMAHADTTTTTFNSTATINGSCVLSTTNVAFGEYSALAADHQLSSNKVTIKCTRGTSWNYYQYSSYYTISGYSDTVAAMLSTANGVDRLYYQAQVADGNWDNDLDRPTSTARGHYVGVATGAEQSFNVNYRVLKNQYIKPGNYVDNVTAYIDF